MEPLQDALHWTIDKGAAQTNFVQQQANSYSSSSLVWNFNTQGEQTVIDRRIYAKTQFKISFTGVATAGARLLQPGYDAPRAYPLMAITQALSVGINGVDQTIQYSDAMQALLRYNNVYELSQYDLSGTPTHLDNSQRYVSLATSEHNPLATYANSAYELGRGAFALDSCVNPICTDGTTPVTAVVMFTIVEPLLISPLLYSSRDLEEGLIGVQNLSATFNLKAGQLDRIWSHSSGSGATFSNVLVEIGPGATASPQLLLCYLSPPVLDSIANIPKMPMYGATRVDTYVNDMNDSLAPGVSKTYQNNAIQIATVPKSIYIYACRSNASKNYTTTDTFFRINSLSLQYLNTSGQFSSMTINDLYNLSVKNGLNMSFTEFNGVTPDSAMTGSYGLCGAPIMISAEDLNLPDTLAANVNVVSQLSFSLNITNVNEADTIPVQIVVVLCYEGTLTIMNNTAIYQYGVVTSQDVVNTRATGVFVARSHHDSLYGGSFWTKLKSFGKKFKEVANPIASASRAALSLPGASEHIPYAQEVKNALEVSKHLGLGMDCGGAVAGAMKKKRKSKAGSKSKKGKKGGELDFDMEGGALMSRGELRNRLF